MKISCKIIEDLLPLYCDGVCSKESETLVTDHLCECKHCRDLLNSMNDSPKSKEKENINNLKSISIKWSQIRKKSIIKGLLIGISVCLLIVLGFILLTQWCFIPVNTQKIIISDVYELENNEIAFNLYISDKLDLNAITYDITDDGIMYITPKRSIIENKRIESFNKGLYYRDYVVCTRGEIKDYTDFSYTDKVLSAIYIGTKNDNILIWDATVPVTKANGTIQKRYTDNKD